MNVAALVANLQLNISNFTKQLGKAQSQMNNFAKGMSAQVSQASKNMTGLGASYKGVANIVQGIFVSKAIYNTLNAIKDCTSAVWEFSSSMEYAEMTYSNLFGSTELAKEFMNVLEDVSAVSPFQMTDLEKATKRLKAYGIQAKNLMYVTQGIMAASAGQGNSDAIESISRAIGQIYTKGTLKAEEARQLAEAGIPVYEILSDKLGLTQEQLGNLADQAIPASKAINALVDGMNERFGGLLEDSAMTAQGIISNIKDNFLLIGKDAFDPVFQAIKKQLSSFLNILKEIRSTMSTSGLGGVLKRFIPPEMLEAVRLLCANLLILGRTFAQLGNIMKNMFLAALPTIINLLNIFLSTVNVILGPLVSFVNIILQDKQALQLLSAALAVCITLWIAWRAKAIAAFAVAGLAKVFSFITVAVTQLSRALTFLIAHPAWAVLAVAGGAFMALALKTEWARNALNKFITTLTSVSGINMDKLLLPSQKSRTADLDKFNNKLEGTADAMGDLADETSKANKAAKSLLSFDEVFRLNEPDEGTSNGITTPGMDDLDLGLDDAALNLDDMMPEDAAFDLFGKDFASKLLDKLKENLGSMQPIAAALIGALLGAAIGKALGHPLLGAAIGALAAGVWMYIADKLGLTPEQKVQAAISTGIGTALGAILGGLIGGPAGAKIGAAVGFLAGSIWGMLAAKLGVSESAQLSTALTAAITGILAGLPLMISQGVAAGLKGGLVVGIATLASGLLADALNVWFKNEFDLTEQDLKNANYGQSIGAILGAIVGTAIGGPGLGTAVGAAAGTFIGNLEGLFFEPVRNKFGDRGAWGMVGASAGAAIGTVVMPGLGTVIGAGLGGLLGAISGGINEIIAGMGGSWENLGAAMSEWAGGVVDAFCQPFIDFGNTVNTIWNEMIVQPIKDACAAFDAGNFVDFGVNIIKGIINGIGLAIGLIPAAIVAFFQGIIDAICNIFGIHSPATTMEPYGLNIVLGILNGMISGISNVVSWVGTFCQTILSSLSSTFSNIGSTISSWASNAVSSVKNFTSNSINNIKTFASNAKSNIQNFATTCGSNIASFVSTTIGKISTWHSNMSSKASSAMSNFKSQVSSGMSGALNSISTFCSTALSKISSWASSFGSWISNTISSAASAVSSFVSSASSRISSAVSTASSYLPGHASGGVFNREHVARFAEGNKAEAIIPLQNQSAMQPFVDAVADGLSQTFGPMLASMHGTGGQQQLQPLYVGTLVADERGLKELERKMKIIRIEEERSGR